MEISSSLSPWWIWFVDSQELIVRSLGITGCISLFTITVLLVYGRFFGGE